MRRVVFFWVAWSLLFLNVAGAQSWVDSILPERAFDAGTVARGSKVHHTFYLVNRLQQEVRIADYKTKCGCTEVKLGARVIPPGTQTTIEAVIDTTRFNGYKPSGLTLVIDQPGYVEVDLNLSCFIRGDITMNPGNVDFGIVTRGNAPRPSVILNLNYAGGNPNWGITRMQTQSRRVSAKLQETSRSGSGQVQYQLTATLDPGDANGYLKDEITLYTNDPGSQGIPLAVSATVQGALTVSPSPLILGQLKPGQEVKKVLIVKSAQPFKVVGVKPGRDEVTAAPASDISRTVHTVNLTIKAPTQPGPFNATVEISSDVKDEPPAKVTAFANIVP